MKPLSDLCFRILCASAAPGCLAGHTPNEADSGLREAVSNGWLVVVPNPPGSAVRARGITTAAGERAIRVHREWFRAGGA